MSPACTPGPPCLNASFSLVSQTPASSGPRRPYFSVLLLWPGCLTFAPFSSFHQTSLSHSVTLGLYSSAKSYSSYTGKFLSAISQPSLPSALLNWQSSCYEYNLQQPVRVAPKCKTPILLRYTNVIFRLLLSEPAELSSVWLRHHTEIWQQARSSHPAPGSLLTATKNLQFQNYVSY